MKRKANVLPQKKKKKREKKTQKTGDHEHVIAGSNSNYQIMITLSF